MQVDNFLAYNNLHYFVVFVLDDNKLFVVGMAKLGGYYYNIVVVEMVDIGFQMIGQYNVMIVKADLSVVPDYFQSVKEHNYHMTIGDIEWTIVVPSL